MAASYDNPSRITYSFNAINFATASQRTIMGPKGKTGRVAFITGSCTTTFVGTSTPAAVNVGDGTTDTLYGSLTFGTAGTPTASGAAIGSQPTDATVKVCDPQAPTNGTPGQNSNNIIVKFAAGTGGTPAGVADVNILIDWF